VIVPPVGASPEVPPPVIVTKLVVDIVVPMLAPAVAEAWLITNLPVVATAADTKPVFVAVEVPYKVKPMSNVGVVPPVAAQTA